MIDSSKHGSPSYEMLKSKTAANSGEKYDSSQIIITSEGNSSSNTNSRESSFNTLRSSNKKKNYKMNQNANQEYFQMCLLSYKCNHKHISQILTLDGRELYEEVCKENLEFFKWHQWIDKKIGSLYLKRVYSN